MFGLITQIPVQLHFEISVMIHGSVPGEVVARTLCRRVRFARLHVAFPFWFILIETGFRPFRECVEEASISRRTRQTAYKWRNLESPERDLLQFKQFSWLDIRAKWISLLCPRKRPMLIWFHFRHGSGTHIVTTGVGPLPTASPTLMNQNIIANHFFRQCLRIIDGALAVEGVQTRDDLQVLMMRLIIFNCTVSHAAEFFGFPPKSRIQIVGMCRFDFTIANMFVSHREWVYGSELFCWTKTKWVQTWLMTALRLGVCFDSKYVNDCRTFQSKNERSIKF